MRSSPPGVAQQVTSGCRIAQGPRYEKQIARPRPRPSDLSAPLNFANQGQIDEKAGGRGGVSSQQSDLAFASPASHPGIELLQIPNGEVAGKGEGDEIGPGNSPHRRDVAHVNGDRLVADVPQRDARSRKVNPFQEQIGGEEQIESGCGSKNSRIIPDPQNDRAALEPPRSIPLADSSDQAELTQRRHLHRFSDRLPQPRLARRRAVLRGTAPETNEEHYTSDPTVRPERLTAGFFGPDTRSER